MNIYCFSTLSFAKLQFKSVINKAFHKHGVASFTDAWIETKLLNSPKVALRSHLLQMRGLKLQTQNSTAQDYYVASFTDAWIETRLFFAAYSRHLSHLLQMRGLKLVATGNFHITLCRIFYRCVDWNIAFYFFPGLFERRIFYRCVDWNLQLSSIILLLLVASFTDAWIETLIWKRMSSINMSHLLQMRGLKRVYSEHDNRGKRSHLLQMRGLKRRL